MCEYGNEVGFIMQNVLRAFVPRAQSGCVAIARCCMRTTAIDAWNSFASVVSVLGKMSAATGFGIY